MLDVSRGCGGQGTSWRAGGPRAGKFYPSQYLVRLAGSTVNCYGQQATVHASFVRAILLQCVACLLSVMVQVHPGRDGANVQNDYPILGNDLSPDRRRTISNSSISKDRVTPVWCTTSLQSITSPHTPPCRPRSKYSKTHQTRQ